jgi:hypothetical protein
MSPISATASTMFPPPLLLILTGLFCLSLLVSIGIIQQLADAPFDLDHSAYETARAPLVVVVETTNPDINHNSAFLPSTIRRASVDRIIDASTTGGSDDDDDFDDTTIRFEKSSSQQLVVYYTCLSCGALLLCVVWTFLFAAGATTCHQRLNHVTQTACFSLFDFDSVTTFVLLLFCVFVFCSVLMVDWDNDE